MVAEGGSRGGQSIQDDDRSVDDYASEVYEDTEAEGEQAAMSTWHHSSPTRDHPEDQTAAATSAPEGEWQPLEQRQEPQHPGHNAEEGCEGAQVWFNTCKTGVRDMDAWVTSREDATWVHQTQQQQQQQRQQHARPQTRSGRSQQSSSLDRKTDCVFRRPPTATRCSLGSQQRPASAGQTWSMTDQLLTQRPVSACLRSIDLTKLPSSSSSRAGTPGSLLAAAVAVVRPSTAGANISACGRIKRYSPGPSSYAPVVDRRCTTLIRNGVGSFAKTSKQQCSYIHAHLQTVCSPGPAAVGAPRPHSSCSAYEKNRAGSSRSSSSSRSRSSSPTRQLMTARLQHTDGGTWCRAGVGTREAPRPKTAPACSNRSSNSSSSSRGGAGGSGAQGSGGGASSPSGPNQQQQQRCVCCGGTSSCRVGTCGMPWGTHLGPGRYEAAVQRDGSTVWFGSTGSAWTWGKAPKMASPVTQPKSITYISAAHAREMCGAATPGPQKYKPRHRGVLSHPAGNATGDAGVGPSMEGKGVNVWTRMEAAARDIPGCKVPSTSPPTHKGQSLWPATPTACINRPASSHPQKPFLSARHVATVNHSSYRSKTHYAYDPGYTQQDRHVAAPSLGSGKPDRFDDYRWSSGRLQ